MWWPVFNTILSQLSLRFKKNNWGGGRRNTKLIHAQRQRERDRQTARHTGRAYLCTLKDSTCITQKSKICERVFIYLFTYLCHTETALRVITDKAEQERIVMGVHEGLGDSLESKALGGHLGFDKTEEKIAPRVWWPGIRKDVRDYIKAGADPGGFPGFPEPPPQPKKTTNKKSKNEYPHDAFMCLETPPKPSANPLLVFWTPPPTPPSRSSILSWYARTFLN